MLKERGSVFFFYAEEDLFCGGGWWYVVALCAVAPPRRFFSRSSIYSDDRVKWISHEIIPRLRTWILDTDHVSDKKIEKLLRAVYGASRIPPREGVKIGYMPGYGISLHTCFTQAAIGVENLFRWREGPISTGEGGELEPHGEVPPRGEDEMHGEVPPRGEKWGEDEMPGEVPPREVKSLEEIYEFIEEQLIKNY